MPSGTPETSPRSPLLLTSSLTLPPPCFLPFSGSQFRTKMMRRDALEIRRGSSSNGCTALSRGRPRNWKYSAGEIKKQGPPLCGTPGMPTGQEEFDDPSVALLADHPAHRSSQGPHRRPCLLAPRNNARTMNPLPQPRHTRCPLHVGCTRASQTQTRLPTSRSFAPPFLHLLGKHGKAGINCSTSDSTWQSVPAIDPKPKHTTDRYQRGLTSIHIRTRDK